ncbi:TonB-dependent receptor [Sphingobacterium olei]|uniref:TonB-dependent receptor n=1 Tax=Sphingobacterium olei TaxID=2571155 RepID=A0A4U0P693_9SPHI|nr:TonB-dependent receptor [Sphingobacterium olei]TJZ62933.1 TonB-dependent receptor [Sphingobacterium olei]
MKKMLFNSCCFLFLFFTVSATLSFNARAQTGTLTAAQRSVEISGSVSDTTGILLPGVSVSVKNRKGNETSTDKNGRYILDVPVGATVVFSMVGYTSTELVVHTSRILNVQMDEASSTIEDVVVVAFGKQKKQEVVGAMTTVNPSDLKVPSSNLTTALAGRVAGMIAYQRSGEPGQDNAEFFIRGVTTFGYKVDPLILIDGVELTSTDLARLQPDDIASFSIMKDATATALYGARGANGVILVTTKQGKEGPAKINFRLESSVSSPTSNVELADPISYMRLHNEAVLTRDPSGITKVPYTDEKIDNTILGLNPYVYPANDWRKELFKDYTFNQRGNLSVSGGGQVARYYIAGTFNQDNGVLKVDNRNNFNSNINLKTYLLRSNVEVNVSKTTELGVRLYGSFDDYTGPLDGGAAMYEKVMNSNPVMFPSYYPVMPGYEHLTHIMFGNALKEGGATAGYINPYADMVKGYREYSSSLMMAQLELKQSLDFITPGLNFRMMGNTNRRAHFQVSRAYKPFYYMSSGFNRMTGDYRLDVINENDGQEWLDFNLGTRQLFSQFYMESAMNYNRTFKEVHGVSAMAVFIMRHNISANANDLLQSLPFRNLGLSGRMTYSFDSRYFGEFNFGYNGSERFHEKNRFGFFPAFGVAWQISNEKFWDPVKRAVPELKLRATYGLVGNDEIGSPTDRFFYMSNVIMNDADRGATFGLDNTYDRPGVSILRYDNADIAWETSEKINLGVEMSLFRKVQIQADFFKEHRHNILMTRASVPEYMGLSAPVRANVGEASGRGMDMSVDIQHNFSSDLWLSARGNFTYAASKFEVYEEPEYLNEYWKSRVGYSLSQRWGYIAERLFVDDQEAANSPRQNFGTDVMGGDIKYRDVNNDGQITPLDQVPIGNPTTPEIVYGFGLSMGYKKIDVSAFFQGLAQESFWIDPIETSPFTNDRQLLKAYADSYWSESDNDVQALWPRLSEAPNTNTNQASTWFMRDGTFLRLKSAELGYSFSVEQLKRLKMQKLRVYVNGTNLLSWSRFKLWDVEMAGRGLGYPVQRVFNLGVNVNF